MSVLEFGCGTGRLAEMLLEHYLPAGAEFVGMDISDTMVSLAKERLARFGDRAKIILTDGSPRLDFRADTFDRFVSCYVLDLMAFEDIRKVLLEASRILSTGGLLCLVSLTHGFTPITRIVEQMWQAVFNFRPKLVGGCRPVSLFEFVPEPFWRILFHEKFSSFGIPSEVLVAQKVSKQLT